MHALSGSIRRLRQNEALLVISVSTVIVMAGQGLVAPILPLFAESFGVSAAVIGLSLSVFGAARLLLNVPLGIVADRWGRRPVLIAGPVVTAVSMLGAATSPNIVMFLVWRFVGGAGSAMFMTGAQIFVADISTAANRGRNIATNQGALLLGVSVGPAIGGLLAEAFGFRAPFYLVGATTLLAALHAWRRLPETRPAARPPEHGAERARGSRPALRLLRSRDFAAVSFVCFVLFLARTAGQQALMPLHATDELGVSPGGLGLAFTVIALLNLAALAPSAMISDRFGRKWAIVPSGCIAAAGLVLVAISANEAHFLAAVGLFGIGLSMAGPAPAAYAVDIAPAQLRGLALGIFRSVGDLGSTIGPTVMGAVADATSPAAGLVAIGVLFAGASILFGFVATETAGSIGEPEAEIEAHGAAAPPPIV